MESLDSLTSNTESLSVHARILLQIKDYIPPYSGSLSISHTFFSQITIGMILDQCDSWDAAPLPPVQDPPTSNVLIHTVLIPLHPYHNSDSDSLVSRFGHGKMDGVRPASSHPRSLRSLIPQTSNLTSEAPTFRPPASCLAKFTLDF